jgi:hypothetical protein
LGIRGHFCRHISSTSAKRLAYTTFAAYKSLSGFQSFCLQTEAWIHRKIFIDWFNNRAVPDAEKYLAQSSLAIKAHLILDNAPGPPETIQHPRPNTEVIFLPPNTTCLIQPLDQIYHNHL